MRPPAVCVKRTQRVPDRGLRLDHGELDGRERDLMRLELRAVAQHAAAGLPEVDDLVALDLDPRVQLVGLAKGVPAPQLVEVGDGFRRRLVVVRDRELERHRGQPVERREGKPRDGRCRRVEPHDARYAASAAGFGYVVAQLLGLDAERCDQHSDERDAGGDSQAELEAVHERPVGSGGSG